MCGIVGIIDHNRKYEKQSLIKRMMRAIEHRGPDSSGIFINDYIGFGHQRLSIIDIEQGYQPMLDQSGTVMLVYNGEVYNYKEIREQLEYEYTFRTHSDTEVILAAYKKWGIDCLHRFRGMFAFAIYDKQAHSVYLVRDRLGIKPLYYYADDEYMLFASEITPLLGTGMVNRKISQTALSGYLLYQYVPTPLSIYKNLYKLEAGNYLKIDLTSGQHDKVQYWELPVRQEDKDEHSCLEEFNELLSDTIKIYLRSDVPFGSFLSGGVDSSFVTALMSNHLQLPVETFSVGYNEEAYSELRFASNAASSLNTNHHTLIITEDDALHALKNCAMRFGEPFSDSSCIPTYFVSQYAAQKVKMVLSGDGGDELFAGYDSYPDVYRAYRNQEKSVNDLQTLHMAQREIFNRQQLGNLLHECNELFDESMLNADEWKKFHPISLFQYMDVKTYLLDDILTKVDRMSMAHSLEVRVPLLDHKVVEYAFSLPVSLKIRMQEHSSHIITKYLLKQSASRFFPVSFLERRKMGFGIPLLEWTRGKCAIFIKEHLRNRSNGIFDWINFDYVQTMLFDFFEHSRNTHISRIWNLFMFSLWYQYVHSIPAVDYTNIELVYHP